MSYTAPVKDMLFVMKELAGIDAVAKLPGYEDAGFDTAQAVLDESAKFCGEVLAPLNVEGDRNPSSWKDGAVTATPGFKEAFRQFVEGGWQGLQHPTEYDGQGLPKLIATPCIEMLNASNLSFALCPLLTDGAIEALLTAGTEAQKSRYVPKLISGEWTGTMNLTEPQAGSDLALVRSRAEPQPDGSYKVFGTKIFITWGEHDMADNIVHLVLARTPNAPEGVKGISLFIVPKFLVNDDGSLGARNDVHCVSIEHKLGIKASPTAVLQYGDHGGAIGYLVGEENRGLEYMFIMMNAARFGVGMQGIGVAERAYQKAAEFAKERVQSRPVDGSAKQSVTIIHHPDVRRMLATMRALTEGARALSYVAAAHSDHAHRAADEGVRAKHQAIYEYLVPIVKGWSTEMVNEVASLGIQVHGGMGFIEETGAAQYYRDARILAIYEGTTAIQANDLVGRKTVRDGGAVAKALVGEIRQTAEALGAHDGPAFAAMKAQLENGARALSAVVDFVVANVKGDPNAVFAGSVPYLKLAGVVLCGWQMARALLVAQQKRADDPKFYDAKIAIAQFYAEHILAQASGFEAAIVGAKGGQGVFALTEDQF
ncbi:acyl-CoA dehydrogenase [Burkholderia thailandensis]|uniref:3-methylmercaptopropionyl-CoA dehydrogenase n=1 Tax=Burkholderia thailandensis (strain ATCC 700388 / DSM 13276 / CCUG 48851 / CIP 106301 / E264) TaxID=271848 RepID=Q2SY07_BURTA|nr:acyl-CoA dehydrogenase [Burkholderia thailandensis]ABC36577.1 acyl-CoA dehydrogenase domain protein [Burkholderia thailandensis E264]AHI72514.1 acyl-CoA dehydrogenase, N-terminal domain protein [Burkholderia thailandensis 2002721723]AIC86148.1 acyl-CoA dehydrogenase, N-terminal domain protein [Burkholderia thailandensis USAMRU Malaysia \